MSLNEEQPSFCERCGKRCRSARGVLQHLRFCRPNEDNQPPLLPPIEDIQIEPKQLNNHENFYWSEKPGSLVIEDIEKCYDTIVYWRRNLFMLPNGATGKLYIRETTRLLNAWYENSPSKECAMKAVHIMPALLLQKPSKTSKSCDHVKALERRLKMWQSGDFTKLLSEAEAIQSRMININTKRSIAMTSLKFKDLMQKGNVNSAIKLLTNNMSGGVLPLNQETLELLRLKHPESKELWSAKNRTTNHIRCYRRTDGVESC